MSRYGVFDAATGELLRLVQADQESVALAQADAPSEVLVEGDFRLGGWRLVDGVPEAFEPPVPVITVAMVRAEQHRRLTYTDWAITRAADPTDGTPVPSSILAQRAAIRAAADALEAFSPIPTDYRADHYWSTP